MSFIRALAVSTVLCVLPMAVQAQLSTTRHPDGSEGLLVGPNGAEALKISPNGNLTTLNGGVTTFDSNVFSPLVYGAKCDGVTDDTMALQTMVTSVNAWGKNAEIQLPVGRCLTSLPLAINTGVGDFFTIKGHGQDTSTIVFTTKTNGLIICEPGAIAAACNGGTAVTTPVATTAAAHQRVELSGFSAYLAVPADFTATVVPDSTNTNYKPLPSVGCYTNGTYTFVGAAIPATATTPPKCPAGQYYASQGVYETGATTFTVDHVTNTENTVDGQVTTNIAAGQVIAIVPAPMNVATTCSITYDAQVKNVVGSIVTIDTPLPPNMQPGCQLTFFDPKGTTAIAIHGTTMMQEGVWSPQTKIEKVAIYGQFKTFPGEAPYPAGYPAEFNTRTSWEHGILFDAVSNTNMNDVLVSGTPNRGKCYSVNGQKIDPYNRDGTMRSDDHHWNDIRCYGAQYGFGTYSQYVEGVFISNATFVGVKQGVIWAGGIDQFTMTNFEIDSDFDAINIYGIKAAQITNGYIIHGSRNTNFYGLNTNGDTFNTAPQESDIIKIGNSLESTISNLSISESDTSKYAGIAETCGINVNSDGGTSGNQISQMSFGFGNHNVPIYGVCFNGTNNVQLSNSSVFNASNGIDTNMALTGWPLSAGGYASGTVIGTGSVTTSESQNHQCTGNSLGGQPLHDNPTQRTPSSAGGSSGYGCYN